MVSSLLTRFIRSFLNVGIARDFRVIFIKIRIALVDAPSVGAGYVSGAACSADRRRHNYAVVVEALGISASELPSGVSCAVPPRLLISAAVDLSRSLSLILSR